MNEQIYYKELVSYENNSKKKIIIIIIASDKPPGLKLYGA